jgi:starch synthase
MDVPFGTGALTAHVMECRIEEGSPVYMIQRDDFYDRSHLYGDGRGDYEDNLERFAFFSHAALRMCQELPFRPDVIHCHDWQTGLVPALLKGPYANATGLSAASTLFTIHNLGYQGSFPADKLSVTGLSYETFFTPEGVEFWGKISLLKAGIVYAQAITTVSPTYAKEIQTSEYGMGMEGVLQYRKASLHGILNGVDYGQWDPAVDPHIAKNFSPEKKDGKRACKRALIKEMKLDPRMADGPVMGMVSRLSSQKGLDLLIKILPRLEAMDAGLVILGSGEPEIEKSLQKAAQSSRGRVRAAIGFDDTLAHRIMAGADIFLIPSRYEPCGLTQMYALKYGTVPVVRATGGLEDTISQFNKGTMKGNGFKFIAYDEKAFSATVEQALELFTDRAAWKKLMANGMKADFPWDRSAEQYAALYASIEKG